METIKDIHAHLFNLKYLPVAGIIRRYSRHKISVRIAIGIEWFLIRKTGASYAEDEGNEIIHPNETGNRLVPIDSATIALRSKDILLMDQREMVDLLLSYLNDEDVFDTPMAAALDEYQHKSPIAVKEKIRFFPRAINEQFTAVEKITIRGLFKGLIEWAMEILDKIIGGVEKGVNHLRWFLVMMKSEKQILSQLQKDNNGVDIFIHHMMDVDHFFTDLETGRFYNSYYSFPAQVRRMHLLQHDNPNEVIGFVAFNPARNNSLEIVRHAVANGFKGVKFYPPMGYKCYGDEKYNFPISQLMKYCTDNDVPLFTHCNNSGFEAVPGESGFNSNPVFWEQLLQQSGNDSLRLCLGHGGGGEGWFAEHRSTDHLEASSILATDIFDDSAAQLDWNKSYAAMVFKLCVLYKNVYCDFSYLDEMIRSNGTVDTPKQENFINRLAMLLDKHPEFAYKIIYGSDWHMLYRENKQKVFYPIYQKMFADTRIAPTAGHFFQTNIKSYAKL
ncbi:MAG: amidohydrolase family protein [Chitinophagaceae bacterium]|nr:amidohydrolase family protein [Chitinophagaceae bacterium]